MAEPMSMESLPPLTTQRFKTMKNHFESELKKLKAGQEGEFVDEPNNAS